MSRPARQIARKNVKHYTQPRKTGEAAGSQTSGSARGAGTSNFPKNVTFVHVSKTRALRIFDLDIDSIEKLVTFYHSTFTDANLEKICRSQIATSRFWCG